MDGELTFGHIPASASGTRTQDAGTWLLSVRWQCRLGSSESSGRGSSSRWHHRGTEVEEPEEGRFPVACWVTHRVLFKDLHLFN